MLLPWFNPPMGCLMVKQVEQGDRSPDRDFNGLIVQTLFGYLGRGSRWECRADAAVGRRDADRRSAERCRDLEHVCAVPEVARGSQRGVGRP